MVVLQRKCMLIEWREKVEELAKKLRNSESRISFEQLANILQDGVDKGFLKKADGKFEISPEALLYGKEYMNNEAEGVLSPLLFNFTSLQKLDSINSEALSFDKQLRSTLEFLQEADPMAEPL